MDSGETPRSKWADVDVQARRFRFSFKVDVFCNMSSKDCTEEKIQNEMLRERTRLWNILGNMLVRGEQFAVDGQGQWELADRWNGDVMLTDGTGKFVTRAFRGTNLERGKNQNEQAMDTRGTGPNES